jgi:bacterioferritin-associated ferredoxin
MGRAFAKKCGEDGRAYARESLFGQGPEPGKKWLFGLRTSRIFPVANLSHYPYIGIVEKDSHMVVCVCNAIRESQLRDVARDGQLRCAKAAYAQLGRKPKCGQCLPFARNIISDVAATA